MTNSRVRRIALQVALVYAVVAALWIVFSDQLVSVFGLEHSLVQTYKGLGFVIVTAAALYVVVSRWVDRALASLDSATFAQERYQALFESNPLPTFLFAIDDRRFLAANEATVVQYGYSMDELLSMTIDDIRPPEDIEAMLEVVHSRPERVGTIGVWRHRTKAGKIILVEIYRHPLNWDGVDSVLVVANDVTAKMEVEQAELRASARLSAIIETSPLAIILLDLDGCVVLWNQAAEEIFGWTAEEVVGAPNPIVPPDEGPEFDRVFTGVLRTGQPCAIEVARQRKDGSRVEIKLYTAAAYGPDGKPEGAYALMEDITARRQAEAELARYRDHLKDLVDERTAELNAVNERLRRATRVKSEFLANMSHELRTPLNSIIGFSGVLLQGLAGDLTEEQGKQVSMVYRAGRHLLELINDILDLSRIEAGRTDVEPSGFDARDLVESVVHSMTPEADAKGVELEFHAESAGSVFTDRTKVQQVLLNLVGNAVKFTASGRVTVRMALADDALLVAVSDTGPGIPKADIPAIFDEFTQAKRRADEKPAGTGLGLAISRKLARMLGGDVFVDSVLGEGSTFELRIPAHYSEIVARGPLVASNEDESACDRYEG